MLPQLKAGQNIIRSRPFRSPHHTTSDVAIVGGGSVPRPGEATLSHVLESLRQPLEDHCVTVQAIKERILKARSLQKGRFAGSGAAANDTMSHRQIKEFCALDNEGKELLKKAIDELGLSARTYDKILKVARTIADPAGSEQVQTEHLAEAIQYRSLDKNGWG